MYATHRPAARQVVIIDNDGAECLTWTVPFPRIAAKVAALLSIYLLGCTADDLHGLASHITKVALLKADEEAARST